MVHRKQRPRGLRSIVALAGVLLLLAAGGHGAVASSPDGRGAGVPPDRVQLQLKWEDQAQFAGFYAARDFGYYAAEGLDVTLLEGGPDITPEQVVADGGAEFGVNWLPSLFASREQGLDIVQIAQLFQRSAMTEVTWKDSAITTIADLRGRRVGVWCCGNQYELYAALRKSGIDPENPVDVQIVDQPLDMDLFLNHQVDAAAATTYNELAQVLESVNPATGQLYTLDDLNVLSMEVAGTGMLEDGIFATAGYLAAPGHQDVAVRFLRASFRGWIYCRDHEEECVRATLAGSPTLGAGHQRWMLNEVNALIWPSPAGIGQLDRTAYDRTAAIALQYGVITAQPAAAAVRTDLARQALAGVQGDTQGLTWQKSAVQVTSGGR